ncbi:MAG: class I SAM-dependent methyltransferase [Lutibacter sp.]
MEIKKEWFETWFNTPYYHILYKKRNVEEAQQFMLKLTHFLNLPKESTILDLGCGKGRHAVFLNKLGYNVTGLDLSENSIQFAKQFENKTLQFNQFDMRNPLAEKYNAIFNLFTSFGFFEDDDEDISILKNIKNGLLDNGVAIIDFMNAYKVQQKLVTNETKTIDNITFNIHRYIENGFIFKEIQFFADGRHHEYTERVKCINFEKAKQYMLSVGFKINQAFGNYQLDTFNENNSDRLILLLS